MIQTKHAPYIFAVIATLLFYYSGARSHALGETVFAATEWLMAGIVVVVLGINMANGTIEQRRIGLGLVWLSIWLGIAIAKFASGVTTNLEFLIDLAIWSTLFAFFYSSYKQSKEEMQTILIKTKNR